MNTLMGERGIGKAMVEKGRSHQDAAAHVLLALRAVWGHHYFYTFESFRVMSMTANSWERNYELRKDGVTVFPGVLEPSQVTRLYNALHACVEQDLKTYHEAKHTADRNMVHNLMFRGQEFLDVLETPELNAIADFLGATFTIYAYQSSSLPPAGTNYSNRVHVDCPRHIPHYATNMGAIFALTDFTKENGASLFLRGSHLYEDVPSDDYFYKHATTYECKAGDLIIFNARTFHSGGMNKTSSYRHAITINFCRAFMKQRFNFPEMTPKDMQANLTLTQRRLLGFNARTPKSLDEYYLPEKERLYLPNQG